MIMADIQFVEAIRLNQRHSFDLAVGQLDNFQRPSFYPYAFVYKPTFLHIENVYIIWKAGWSLGVAVGNG